jgi:DNA-binding MarR family transcriptional regulator
MRQTSIIAALAEGFTTTTEDGHEKLYAALPMIDNVAPISTQRHSSRQPISEQAVRLILKARRSRDKYFPANLFADPAWDMLLELYAAELGQRRMSISSLCIGAGVPATTALRWISTLEKNCLLDRSNDPFDGRRVWVYLSAAGSEAMTAYFTSHPQLAGRGVTARSNSAAGQALSCDEEWRLPT